MNITPLLTAPIEIQLHVVCALTAVAIGPVALYRKRRDRIHKTVGYVWVVAMFCVAMSGFFIHSSVLPIVAGIGPIHLFSAFTLWSLWVGMRAIFRKDMKAHLSALRALYWQGIIIAALFNFLPGRRMNRTFFADDPQLGYVVLGAGIVGLIWMLRKRVSEPVAI